MSARGGIALWLVMAASLFGIADGAAQSLPCPLELVNAGKTSGAQTAYAPRDNNRYCDGLVFAPHSGSLSLVSLTLGDVVFPDGRQALNIAAPGGPFAKIVLIGQRLQLGQTYRFDSVLEGRSVLSISRMAVMFSSPSSGADFGFVGTAASDAGPVRVPVKIGGAADTGQPISMIVRTSVPLLRVVFDFLDAGTRQPIDNAPRIVKDQIVAGQLIVLSIPREGTTRRILARITAKTPGGELQALLESILIPARP